MGMVQFDRQTSGRLLSRSRPVAKRDTAVTHENEVAASGVVQISEHDRARDERDGERVEFDPVRIGEVESSQQVRENQALNARMVEDQVDDPGDGQHVESDEQRDVFAMRLEIVDELVGDLLESRRRGQLVHLGAVLSEDSHPM